MYVGLTGESLEERQRLAGEAVPLEGIESLIMGSVDTKSSQAMLEKTAGILNPLGLNQQATGQLLQGVAGSVGLKASEEDITNSIKRIAVAEKTGTPASLLGVTAGAIAQITGKAVGEALEDSLTLKNFAEKGLDLRGQGVNTFLQSFTSMVDQFAEKGITIDPLSLAKSIKGIAKATRTRGERPAQLTSSLISFSQGVGGDIKGALSSFAEMALLADASSGATDLFSFLKRLEEQQADPTGTARKIFQAGGGGRDGAALLASIEGIGVTEALGLGRAKAKDLGKGDRIAFEEIEAVSRVSAAFAKSGDKAIKTVREDTDLIESLIQISSDMQTNLLKMSENEENLTSLAQTIVDVNSVVVAAQRKATDALDAMKRFFQ